MCFLDLSVGMVGANGRTLSIGWSCSQMGLKISDSVGLGLSSDLFICTYLSKVLSQEKDNLIECSPFFQQYSSNQAINTYVI